MRIRGFGNVFTKHPGTGKAKRIANLFLDDVQKEIYKICALSAREFEYIPFHYHERQTTSVLCPAIAAVSNNVLVEIPVKRKSKKAEKSNNGRIDFYCNYSKHGYDVFIEAKHNWINCLEPATPKKFTRKWNEANEQLSDARKSMVWHSYGNGIVRIALLIAPYYFNQPKRKNIEVTDELVLEKHAKLLADLKKRKPNWHSVCLITDPNFKNCDVEYLWKGEKGKVIQTYPAISIFARVFKFIKR